MKSTKASKKSTAKGKTARRQNKSAPGAKAKAKPKAAAGRDRATGRRGGAKAPARASQRSSRRSDKAGPVRAVVAPEAARQPAATPPAALTVHEALRIAIGFEHKVRDHYARGASVIEDPQGRKVFAALAKEEQSHVDFLESRLAAWSATGSSGRERLTSSALPSPAWVREAQARHRTTASLRRVADQSEVELLKTALKLEQEASSFYHDLVRRLAAGDRDLFEPFLTIEEGHLTLVQAELDAVQGWGYWFDIPEFALEAQ